MHVAVCVCVVTLICERVCAHLALCSYVQSMQIVNANTLLFVLLLQLLQPWWKHTYERTVGLQPLSQQLPNGLHDLYVK